MLNDRIYATEQRALTVYATDGLRHAVSALAKLSQFVAVTNKFRPAAPRLST